MFKQATKKEFIEARNQLTGSKAAFITPYTEAEYNEMGVACYLSNDGKSGYALTEEKDLISVFSLNHNGTATIKDAIKNGAKTLDCLGEDLAAIYTKFGFVEIDRFPWDDKYAPENWNYEAFGRPDVIFMRLKSPP